MLQKPDVHGRMLTVTEGFLECPYCRQNRRVMRIGPQSRAVGVVAYCRRCKNEIIIDIEDGQCFESRSQ